MKVIPINSVLNDTLQYLEDKKHNIVDIITLIRTKEDTVEFLSTTMDLNLLYLMKRKIDSELDYISEAQFPEEDLLLEFNN